MHTTEHVPTPKLSYYGHRLEDVSSSVEFRQHRTENISHHLVWSGQHRIEVIFSTSNLPVVLDLHSPRMSHGTLTTQTFWKSAWGAPARASELTHVSLVDPRSRPPQVRNSVLSVSEVLRKFHQQAGPRRMLKMTCRRRGVGSLALLLGFKPSATSSCNDQ